MVATTNSTVMRQLLGEDVLEKPLLPQPGNIWADVLPPARPGAPLASAGNRGDPHPGGAHPMVAATSVAAPPRPSGPVILASARAPALPPVEAAALLAVPVVKVAPPPIPHPSIQPAAASAAPRPVGNLAALQGSARLAVQLAAVRSAELAEAEWRRLRQDAPTLTDGHDPAVTEAEVNGQHVWRLRAMGFADLAQASAFCGSIRAVKVGCWVVPPTASP
jgi:hypothetical protein